jgi:hypothetical protein
MPNQASTQANQTASRGRTTNTRPESSTSKRTQGQAMTGEQAAADQVYGVVSVLYHALQGTQTYEQYANDARKAGDSELEEFFNTCRAEEIARAKQAKSLLLERLDEDEEEETAGSEEDEDEDEDEEESEDEE